MSAACVRWLLNYSARAIPTTNPIRWSPLSRPNKGKPGPFPLPFSRSTLCTAAEDPQPAPEPKKKKPSGANAAFISSVGRKIHHRLIQVIGDNGDNMGTMHRSDVIRLMDQQGLKLVLLSETEDPPVYRLMSGKQIHQEQMRLREKQKTKSAQVQVKELRFFSSIASQDRSTKLKQIENWLEKKHHVKITLRFSRGSTENQETALENLLQHMEVDYGFVSTPQVIQDGQACSCILRPPSAKELAQKPKKTKTSEVSKEPSSTKDTSETSEQP